MEYRPKCIREDNSHKPDYLVKLYEIERSMGEEVVFSWCGECGATSVDRYCDGRFNSTIVDMQFPRTLGLLVKLLEADGDK
jgi:hypothetical protein